MVVRVGPLAIGHTVLCRVDLVGSLVMFPVPRMTARSPRLDVRPMNQTTGTSVMLVLAPNGMWKKSDHVRSLVGRDFKR